jgi:hypothetical protein
MAKLSTQEEIALHEFSVRYRAALAKRNPMPLGFDSVRLAVREDYEQEQIAERAKAPEPPAPTKEHLPEDRG